MKSIILIYKQRNLSYYVKKSITEKNTVLFTFQSHQLFLIPITKGMNTVAELDLKLEL